MKLQKECEELKNKLSEMDDLESLKICRLLKTFEKHDETSLIHYAKIAAIQGNIEESKWAQTALGSLYYPNFSAKFLINYFTFFNKVQSFDEASGNFISYVINNDGLDEIAFNAINNFVFEKYNLNFLDSLILKLQSEQLNSLALNKLIKLYINIKRKGLRYSMPLIDIIERHDKDAIFDLLEDDELYLWRSFSRSKLATLNYREIEYSISILFSVLLSDRRLNNTRKYLGNTAAIFVDSLEMGGNERNGVFTSIELKNSQIYQKSVLLHFSNEKATSHWQDMLEKHDIETLNLNREYDAPKESWINFRLDLIDTVFKDCDLIVKDFRKQLKSIFLGIVYLELDHIHTFCSDIRCILVGIASILAEVPCVSLNPGSMSPNTRLRVRPEIEYLIYSAYRTFLQYPHINLFFCSVAACLDYRDWLSITDEKQLEKLNVNYVSMFNDFEVSENGQLKGFKKTLPRKKESEVVIVGCFRFHPVKRPLLWIKIALELADKHDNVKFIMMGDGQLLDQCKDEVNATKYSDRFNFLGAVQDTDTIYKYADLTFMTSISEGLGNVILEAQKHGVVAVVPYVGGMPETIIHGKNGYIVNLAEYNTKEMVSSLSSLVEDEVTRKNMSSFAKMLVKANYGKNTMLNNVLSIIPKSREVMETVDEK